MLKCCMFLMSAVFLSTIILAEDVVVKEPKPKEEAKPKEETKPKSDKKDVEVTGTVVKKENKDSGAKYYIKTESNLLVHLPNKIEDKEVDLDVYKDKEIIAKGKGEVSVIPKKKGDIKIIKITQLLSIELKNAPATEKQSEDKK